MIVLDTSALIRFFTNDIPSKAREVKKLIEGEQRLFVPDVVFPELEYVLLSKTYNASRKKIIRAFQFLVTRKNITVSPEVKRAVYLYEKTKLDIADCLIIASAKKGKLFSFDQKLLELSQDKQKMSS
jgi:predicted nucleic acid-binding protein